ncbi:conserved hypothetical protein [Sphingomonas aurantiaca]|uniref:Uncharacterized protein n=1 Tax=Sphingomonas aurantiaca TaxID=185949 RepID=A0A5E7YLW9_9SPHN|nr:hypothetical protein [Sphingomonas aurantiaca]VVT07312.1 conserved hypothetical protein [Sphingomonas aurantiaca]
MITFYTENPKSLLAAFNAAIALGSGKGSITTWDIIDGDYTHAADQWNRQAYFEAVISPGILQFGIVRNQANPVSIEVYAYYHGHLIETFLRHFDQMFDTVTSTALALQPDRVT